ncbi:hypothetical protein SLA2020_374010 [Shorea laevis]
MRAPPTSSPHNAKEHRRHSLLPEPCDTSSLVVITSVVYCGGRLEVKTWTRDNFWYDQDHIIADHERGLLPHSRGDYERDLLPHSRGNLIPLREFSSLTSHSSKILPDLTTGVRISEPPLAHTLISFPFARM